MAQLQPLTPLPNTDTEGEGHEGQEHEHEQDQHEQDQDQDHDHEVTGHEESEMEGQESQAEGMHTQSEGEGLLGQHDLKGKYPRARAQRSLVWDHFSLDVDPAKNNKQVATCHYCSKVQAANVTRLREHLTKECNETPQSVKDAVSKDPAQYNKNPLKKSMPKFMKTKKATAEFFGKDVPIPPRPDGFRYNGTALSPIQLEVFLDPCCPYSRGGWNNIKDVAMHYRDRVSILVHVFPLPYHHNSFTICQVGTALGKANHKAFFIWLEQVFQYQEEVTNAKTENLTPEEIATLMVGFGEEAGFTEQLIRTALADPAADHATRISWKYACTRNISGTPMFLVNGVMISGCATWDLKRWKQLLDPLIF
eukprot:comp45626_c0_seq1/m.47553 comp45626_c0_seq1/g.47553  ORF comp45626_c0_seq1/g.47553 comp45626_c0_seq1/m.47553 type:complete len:365 (-) comp45626_c0_seq1:116-1210(-)